MEQHLKSLIFIVIRDDKGGVIGVDLMNSLNILAGGDVLFAKFNKGKSEYTLNYTTAFQKFNSNNRTRTGSYQLKTQLRYREMKSEMVEIISYQMHDVTFGYNYQQSDSVFFKCKLK